MSSLITPTTALLYSYLDIEPDVATTSEHTLEPDLFAQAFHKHNDEEDSATQRLTEPQLLSEDQAPDFSGALTRDSGSGTTAESDPFNQEFQNRCNETPNSMKPQMTEAQILSGTRILDHPTETGLDLFQVSLSPFNHGFDVEDVNMSNIKSQESNTDYFQPSMPMSVLEGRSAWNHQNHQSFGRQVSPDSLARIARHRRGSLQRHKSVETLEPSTQPNMKMEMVENREWVYLFYCP